MQVLSLGMFRFLKLLLNRRERKLPGLHRCNCGEAYCTVDPALWREMQNKLQSFREEQAGDTKSAGSKLNEKQRNGQEWLLGLLRSDNAVPVKKDGFYGTLAEDCREST